MKVAYVRVSTEEQNEARQIEALRAHSIEKRFTEKISGKSMDRPQLQAMLDYMREGDTGLYSRLQPPRTQHQGLAGDRGAVTEQGCASGQQQREPRHRNPYRKADVDHDCSHQ